MNAGTQSDFESLSRSVAGLEKKAKKGGRKEKKEGKISSFISTDYDSISFFDVLSRVSALESMLGKRTITKFETEREMATLQSKLQGGMQQKIQKPIKEPSQKSQLDEIYAKLPRKIMGHESAGKKAPQKKEAEFQPLPAQASKQRDDMAIVPEGMLGDVELARKEMKLSDAEREIAGLKRELADLKLAKDSKLGAESEKLKNQAEAERKKEMEEAQRKISLLTKSLEDDYERKLAREIAKIKAAKSEQDIAKAQAAGSTTLSQLESYLTANPPKKKGLAQAFNSLQNLLGQKSKAPQASMQELQQARQALQEPARLQMPQKEPVSQAPVRPSCTQPPASQNVRKQAEDIEKMREDFERKSREIRLLLKKKEEK